MSRSAAGSSPSPEDRPSSRGARRRARSSPTSTPHDALFKATLGKVQHARSLLRSALPPALSTRVRWATLPRFRLVLDDVSRATDDELLSRSLTALAKLVLVCLRHSRDMRSLLSNLRPWADIFADVRKSRSGLRAYGLILRYILGAADLRPQELRALVEGATSPEVEEEMLSTADMLFEEGMQKGLREGQARTVLKLLRLKFRRLPAGTTERVRAASEKELERWTERVLTAASLADVLDS